MQLGLLLDTTLGFLFGVLVDTLSDDLQLSSQVQNLTPQLVNAGTIKMNYPENKAADENFENLRKQYAAGVQTIRDFCDEAIDIRTFLKQTSDHIQVYSSLITKDHNSH